ncbi:pentapeptide repeat-containing protein [Microcoleus sp. FACHB-672]|uniref:pentapeptide repeat-containing protein n=1 Tax=Microcoleus sp. FACHB-672 TaxID=2692825 RepID=UPI0016858599|nr:pentapeptide repeat-containing protein [Microcoleus sp. FACHB-672]MBD2042877.1 pentapeptide repeat-containing protein [Microcoleus sp. FACHB-672]
MTPEPDSSKPTQPQSNVTLESLNGADGKVAGKDGAVVATDIPEMIVPAKSPIQQTAQPTNRIWKANPIALLLASLALMILGLVINNPWLGVSGAIISLLLSLLIIWPFARSVMDDLLPSPLRGQFLAALGILAATLGLLKYLGVYLRLTKWAKQIQWDAVGSLAEWFGALGQIFIAVLAVYIAWQQYVISRDLTLEQNRLTSQQNILTQQQTIDAYFQGVSDLALDDEGLLEDWPQERAFSEGRTAAILGSVDAAGKAKVLRFLSQSRLLTPLKRDRRLGRPILNGDGGYEEDRAYGVRVIDLGVMLAGADLTGTDLRWTELSEANLIRANLSRCDLVKANFARCILYEANLSYSDFKGVRLFYGKAENATPRSRTEYPDYKTGLHTGAVIESANFTGVERLDDEQRYYCCAWGGEQTRATIPGGCEGIPNKLGR